MARTISKDKLTLLEIAEAWEKCAPEAEFKEKRKDETG